MAVGSVARITIPVDADRPPAATIEVASTLARQGGTAVEFVAVAAATAPASREPTLRACCDAALAAGAPRASWTVLERAGDIGSYATWSGSSAICVGGRRHRPELAARDRAVVRGAAIPVLVVGPRAHRPRSEFRRLVVGLDSTHHGDIAMAAVAFGRRLELDVVLTEVVPLTPAGGDVHESAFLHRVAVTEGCAGSTFDTLHGERPADGIIRFVGHDEQVIIAVGAPIGARGGPVPGGHVARAVIRRAPCPVLLVPFPVPRRPYE